MTEIDVRLAAGIIALPTATLTLSECLYRDLDRFYLVGANLDSGYLTWVPMLISITLLGGGSVLAFRHGKDGVLAALAGFVLALFVEGQLRGSYIWPGFFDYATMQSHPLYRTLMAGFMIGFAAYIPVVRENTAPLKPTIVWAFLLPAVVYSWLHASINIGVISAYAYTRQTAISALALLVFCIALYQRFEEAK